MVSDAYPAHAENPIPYGGDEAAWKLWVERTTILRESNVTCSAMGPEGAVAPGLLPATASLTVDYHRPALAPLTVSARCTNVGRTLVFVEVDITNRDGRRCNRAPAVMAVKGEAR
ncbi:MAG: hypothetical protein QOF76_4064 [Solirubrobacteraceae bacterium]|jgi:acyl-coenzyme A thioesterase PaaI-like protein|nr:hypothetical protein [Solirubrobacteraceae bacterium]